jgi:hypothetical protein
MARRHATGKLFGRAAIRLFPASSRATGSDPSWIDGLQPWTATSEEGMAQWSWWRTAWAVSPLRTGREPSRRNATWLRLCSLRRPGAAANNRVRGRLERLCRRPQTPYRFVRFSSPVETIPIFPSLRPLNWGAAGVQCLSTPVSRDISMCRPVTANGLRASIY